MLYNSISYGDAWHIVSSAVFGTTLILMYLASTLYHAAKDPELKKKLRVMDHSAIFLLIAGSYTPFALVSLRESWGPHLLIAVWSIGVFGVYRKLQPKNHTKNGSLPLYLLMGWLAILAIKPMIDALSTHGLYWLVAGGVVYTAGVGFYVMKQRFMHAIWHLFVMGGSACHVMAVVHHVIPTGMP